MEAKPVFDALAYTAAGFASGSVLYSAYLPMLLKGVDITKASEDSNPGAHNAFQYAGVPVGMLCLACDMAKGYAPVLLAQGRVDVASPLFALVMLSPVAGHAFSPLKHFHGGKGIAVSFGVLMALIPKRWMALLLAGAYLLSLLLPVKPNEKRTVIAFSAFAAIAIALDGPVSVKLGCLLVAMMVVYKNWRDAQIRLRLLDKIMHR